MSDLCAVVCYTPVLLRVLEAEKFGLLITERFQPVKTSRLLFSAKKRAHVVTMISSYAKGWQWSERPADSEQNLRN